MNKKTITVVAIAALAFLYFRSRAATPNKPGKKKLKPVIIPQPLQNITEAEYYGNKADFKAGEISDSSLTAGAALSIANAAGIIPSTAISSAVNAMPITNELQKAFSPGRCN